MSHAILNLFTPDEVRTIEDRMRSTLRELNCKLVKLADDDDEPGFTTYIIYNAEGKAVTNSSALHLTDVAEYICS